MPENRYARVVDGKVWEVWSPPPGQELTPDQVFMPIAGEWVEAGPDVRANWTYADGKFSAPVPQPVDLPEITKRQFLTFLATAHSKTEEDLLSGIDALPAKQKAAVRIAWDYPDDNRLKRDSESVNKFANVLGLSDEQMDEVFREGFKT